MNSEQYKNLNSEIAKQFLQENLNQLDEEQLKEKAIELLRNKVGLDNPNFPGLQYKWEEKLQNWISNFPKEILFDEKLNSFIFKAEKRKGIEGQKETRFAMISICFSNWEKEK